MKYIRGYLSNLLPDNKTLVIELAGCKHNCEKCKNTARVNESGQQLTAKEIKLVVEQFKKYIDTVCFVGGEENQVELKSLCKLVHTEKINTCLSTVYNDTSMLNKALVEELDYIMIGRCDQRRTIYKKDYCPFADAYDWIEI